MYLFAFSTLSALIALSTAAPTSNSTIVRASTGYYTGQINANYSNVREFLNIPYGQSTAGKNRFMPPVAVPMSSNLFDATQYCPSCPQFVSANPSIWNRQIPQYLVSNGNANHSTGASNEFTSEECLSVAIWTPANATSADQLPVAMFWTGGGFQTNGILVPGQIPAPWVSRTQSHIVITINYRMNIMGFPNAAGVYDQNLGLMDQRMALQWARDNIHYFGGDPSRIMVWGQSAGAESVDYHNYAFWEDPIAHAMFCQSGTAMGTPDQDYDHTNFTFVARNVGCDFPSNATAELTCMQSIPYSTIINFMGRYQDNSTQPSISFNPSADERLVFTNNTVRYASGMVSHLPMIYSSVANEGGSLTTYPFAHPRSGPNQTAANEITTSFSLCPGATTSMLRHSIGLTTYRYQYAGNWTNQDPLPWMGAYHSSDLVMHFGTYNSGVEPMAGSESLEARTSREMQDLVLRFMTSPEAVDGWPVFDPSGNGGGTMLRFGADGKVRQEVDGGMVQAVCFGDGMYNPFP